MTAQTMPLTKSRCLSDLVKPILLLWERPIPAALFSILIFTGISLFNGMPWRMSSNPYFNYLADAFLHGQLALRLIPPETLDLSIYQGNYYLYWGPMPAIVAIPWVALFGVNASDVLQSILFGGLNAALAALLLRAVEKRGLLALTPVRRALLVIFFTLGTAHATLPAIGNVWYIASLLTVTFALLAFLAVFSLEHRGAFFWAGVAMAACIATRISAVFNGIFLAWYLYRRYRSLGWRRLITYSLFGAMPILVTGILILWYNDARFGNIFEQGTSYHSLDPMFADNFKRYGLMNLHYIPMNFYMNYIYYPFTSNFVHELMLVFNGSLILLSPLYIALFFAIWHGRRNADNQALLVTIILGHIPAMMIMTPTIFLSSTNFGPRYFLDFAVPLLLLTAMGVKNWHIRWVWFLTAISVIHYLFGAYITTGVFE